MSRKVAILGFGPTSKDAPFLDRAWELWGMNGFWRMDYAKDVPEDRFTCWLEMHDLAYISAYGVVANVAGLQEAWLAKKHPFPIYALAADLAQPSVVRFPIETVIRKLGRDYFTSTVAYALAWALYSLSPGDEIGLWGVDLTHNTEYELQRPCAEYWIGRIEAAGIKVTIHQDSALLRQDGRYGYEAANPVIAVLKKDLETQATTLDAALKATKEQIASLTNQLYTDDGALQVVRMFYERVRVIERGGKP